MTSCVAYFSAEFGLDASIPIYSGGLGVLAGDHIKAANDLGLPLVGVGIFYRNGYFDQRIREDGTQEHDKQSIHEAKLPLEPVLDGSGQPVKVSVPIEGRQVVLQAYCIRVGSVPAYLLHTDGNDNSDDDRCLTDHLYPSSPALRLSQEIILGIGGARLLHALGLEPEVWHMNEGHSAFLSFERIRRLSEQGLPFETAVEAVKASNVFTTHTPVPAGHDVFSIGMIDRFLGDVYWQLGASREQILELGRIGDMFNMTRLAVTTSSCVNGVSKLHAKVTQSLFHGWLPHIPESEIAVKSVTNGVHLGTWMSEEMKGLLDRFLKPGWQMRASQAEEWSRIRTIPDHELWNVHQSAKQRMIEELELPNALNEGLVIGFARRFATYKRALLLFRDLDRLERIMHGSDRPVYFLFAGKAHPADEPGKQLIKRLVCISKDERFRDRIFVIENYNMDKGALLVQGVDVWLNTPARPMEASGTSGQKAALNGVLNCSILDGWWVEGYNGSNGWAIGSEAGEGWDDNRDEEDVRSLYQILEEQMIPLYFSRNADKIPSEWVAVVKESLCTLGPAYNTQRIVDDYWRQIYVPAAKRGARLSADRYLKAEQTALWKRYIRTNWGGVQVLSFELKSQSPAVIRAVIRLGVVWRGDVFVEAVGPDGNGGIWVCPLTAVSHQYGEQFIYEGQLPDAAVPETNWSEVNVRVVPVHTELTDKFEMELAAWGATRMLQKAW